MAAVIKSFAGLYTTGNYIGSVPEGAMAVARNVVIKALNVVSQRRGQFHLPSTFGNPGDLGNALISYGDTLFVQHGVSGLSRYNAVADTFTAYSSAAPSDGGPTLADVHAPAGNRLRGVEAANNVYLSGAKGVRRIDSVTGSTSRAAGTPPAPDGSVAANAGGTLVPVNGSVSYRVVFGNLDSDGTLRLGAPSGRMVAVNANVSPADPLLNITIPEGVYPGDVMRLYRTETSTTSEPGDEHFLVYETTVPSFSGVLAGGIVPANQGFQVTPAAGSHPFVQGQYLHTYQSYTPTGVATELESGTYYVLSVTGTTFNIASHTQGPNTGTVSNPNSFVFYAKSIVYIDTTPDSFLSNDPLYTNPNTGNGPLAANYEPPIAKDIELFATRLFGANVLDRRTRTIQLLGVGAPNGLQPADTVTIGSRTWTATSAAGPTAFLAQYVPDKWFMPYTAGTPAQNVEQTARNLVRSINLTAEATVFAFYVSGANDAPGRILLREKLPEPAQSTLTVSTSRALSWAFLGNFDPNVAVNGLTYSEPDEPEAFTVTGYSPVAAENDDIRRVKRLRENLFVFKRRGGAFVVPQAEPFRVSEFDPTCRIVADDTVVILDNRIWALTEQGLVSISESGVQITGWPIDVDIKALFRDMTRLNRLAFAVAYETEFTVELWLPLNDTAESAGKSYWYNVQTNTWVEQPLSRRFGLVTPLSDVEHYCSATTNSLVKERKSRDFTDYADEALTVTISGVSSTAVTLSSAAGIVTGDMLLQGVYSARIDLIAGNVLTVSTPVPFTNGAATVLKAIESEIRPQPVTLGQPAESKQIAEMVCSFRPGLSVYSPTALIQTDEDPTTAEYALPYTMGTGYGTGGYGEDSYGGRGLKAIRRNSVGTTGNEFTPGLRIREARTVWELQAITVEVNAESQRAAP
jgi:hypothetical protein